MLCKASALLCFTFWSPPRNLWTMVSYAVGFLTNFLTCGGVLGGLLEILASCTCAAVAIATHV